MRQQQVETRRRTVKVPAAEAQVRRKRPSKVHTDPEIIALITAAAEEIVAKKYDTLFVRAERAEAKRRRIEPSDRMVKLQRFIERHGEVSYRASLGMNWTSLGGLMTRGLVEHAMNEKGEEVVRIVTHKKAKE
jgi:hypothetical protein